MDELVKAAQRRSQYLPIEVEDIELEAPAILVHLRPTAPRHCPPADERRMLKPHDLRHGIALEVYERYSDLKQVRGLLRHNAHRDDTALCANPAGRTNRQSNFTSRRRSNGSGCHSSSSLVGRLK
jgi:hypothetical protein